MSKTIWACFTVTWMRLFIPGQDAHWYGQNVILPIPVPEFKWSVELATVEQSFEKRQAVMNLPVFAQTSWLQHVVFLC